MDTLKRQMISALEKSLGIVTTASKESGVSRSIHYQWLQQDEEYKAAVQSIEDIALDFVESKLFQKITGVTIQSGVNDEGEAIVYEVPPSDTACIFYLKTKGKNRGYIERTEFDHKVTGPAFELIIPDGL